MPRRAGAKPTLSHLYSSSALVCQASDLCVHVDGEERAEAWRDGALGTWEAVISGDGHLKGS